MVQISPRLTPGIAVGDAWLSVYPSGDADSQGKPGWRYYIDTPEWEHEGDDLYGWGDAGGMLVELCAYLSACAEARAYQRGTGVECELAALFPDHVGEWAELHDDEIWLAGNDSTGGASEF